MMLWNVSKGVDDMNNEQVISLCVHLYIYMHNEVPLPLTPTPKFFQLRANHRLDVIGKLLSMHINKLPHSSFVAYYCDIWVHGNLSHSIINRQCLVTLHSVSTKRALALVSTVLL